MYWMMVLIALAFGVRGGEADWRDGRWANSDVGPCLASTLSVETSRVVACISVKVGGLQAEGLEGGVAFDSAACGVRAGWTGGFLTFNPTRYGVIVHPRPAGTVAFHLMDGELWNKDAKYLGYTRHEHTLVFHYQAGDAAVSESSALVRVGKTAVFVRRFAVAAHNDALTLKLAAGKSKPGFALHNAADTKVVENNGAVQLDIPPSNETQFITLLCAKDPVDAEWANLAVVRVNALKGMDALSAPGPRLYSDEPPVTGVVGANQGGLAFDEIPVPHKNAAKVLLFLTGVDFLPNGDAAVCSLHGDVWIAKGIDAELKRVVWQRYATGLFQPLGLKVVNGAIHVLGRDQITRLEDANNDGEADHYRVFFRNPSLSPNGHDYTAGLETDSKGNFYYVCPKGLHRVSGDGQRHEIIARGWRNPMGLGVGPADQVTVSPQEGNWTPASMICVVKPDGYYGFPGPKVTPERPQGFDAPLCWLPRAMDNSTGGQTWVSGKEWGALEGRMVNLSYGRCTLQLVHADVAGNTSITPVNYRFSSGICRGRMHPADGALYVVGTMGWQTNANVDGCLQRMRRTANPLLYPVETWTYKDGVLLTFAVGLNRAEAEDAGGYFVEAWGYSYSKNYGSAEFTQSKPDVKGRDEWAVSTARVSGDGRSVFLKIEPFQKTQQMLVKYNLRAKSGEALKGEVAFTIHAVPTQTFVEP